MIEIQNITKSFGSLQVLKGIDLHIAKGEIVSIVGPSGAGKTTLLQIIGTLDKPDTGSSHKRPSATSATAIWALSSSSTSCCLSSLPWRTS